MNLVSYEKTYQKYHEILLYFISFASRHSAWGLKRETGCHIASVNIICAAMKVDQGLFHIID